MSFGFLTPVMLIGLAALAIPVIVHLLSKRRYDVVDWGAMQFLELGKRMRRRVRLQDLLLMAVRMGVLGLLACGMARPWARGGVLSAFNPEAARDIAIVIDGSYSMGWEGTGVTPRAAAIQQAHELLGQCHAGDTVTLIDAREQPDVVAGTPTTDLSHVRRSLDALPPPSGTSRLAAAIAEAVQKLAFTTNASRHVLVLTDRQALPWLPDADADWTRLAELQRSLPIPPQVFAVDVTDGAPRTEANVSVDPLVLSRDLTVPDFPIRVRTSLRQSGDAPLERRVSFELNGQRLDEQSQTVTIPPHGQSPLEIEYRFAAVGSYVVSVSVEPDKLPGDDQSSAAVVVDRGLRVLLIDGDPQSDPVRSETYFLKAAFSPADNQSPWVSADVVSWRDWKPDSLKDRVAVFLCNVPRLEAGQRAALKSFVESGGGLVIAPGDRIDAAAYAELQADGLLPYNVVEQKREQDYTLRPIQLDPASLETGWLSRFRTSTGVDLAQTRFAQWWQLRESETTAASRGAGPPGASASRIDGRLKTLDPLIVSASLGMGTIVELGFPLDADWSTLPTRNDFVPFVHELVFSLVARSTDRNVAVGAPLRLALGDGQQPRDWTFIGPAGTRTPGRSAGADRQVAELPTTYLAGIYEAEYTPEARPREYFVAASDRAESDLTPLDDQQLQALPQAHGVRFVDELAAYEQATRVEPEPVEIWRWLLLAVLAGLILETIITRQLVRRGHMDLDEPAPSAA